MMKRSQTHGCRDSCRVGTAHHVRFWWKSADKRHGGPCPPYKNPCGRKTLVALFVGLALAAAVEPASDVNAQRERLLKLAADPAQANRLRQNLAAFRALPPARQERLRQLVRDLRNESASTQARWHGVLERYAHWHDRLSPAARNSLDTAPPEARLAVVKATLERQWLEGLPRPVRDDLARRSGADREATIKRLRDDDRDHRATVQAARLHAEQQEVVPLAPAMTEEFRREVHAFVTEFLRPLVTPEEERRLANEEKRIDKPNQRFGTLRYYQTVLELSERHPLTLPGPGTRTIKRFDDVPADVRKLVSAATVPAERWANVKASEGKWPDYPLRIAEAARELGVQLPADRLGASRPSEFGPRLRRFIAEFSTMLPATQQAELREAEGKWPEYPERLKALAERRGVPVPGLHLPGPPAVWETIRRFRLKGAMESGAE